MPRRPAKLAAALVAYAYIRMSKDEQTLSPEAQRDVIEKFAAREKITILGWFEDLGLSGGLDIDERPGLLATITAVNARKHAAMLIAKHDRLARDEFTAASVYRLVERAGGKVLAADGVGNDGTPESHLLRSIVAAFAAYERAQIRIRTKAALKVKKAHGERVGQIPFGYRQGAQIGFNHKKQKPVFAIESDPAEQQVVERIRKLAIDGSSYPAIAAALHTEGVPARGAKWHTTTIGRIVRREAV